MQELTDEQISAVFDETNGISSCCNTYWPRRYARAILAAHSAAQTAAARDVLAERHRQIDVEGFTPVSDDRYHDGVLALAAGSYALHAHDRRLDTTPARWPWPRAWWKPGTPRQMLVKAGALILAAIEQIDRRAAKAQSGE